MQQTILYTDVSILWVQRYARECVTGFVITCKNSVLVVKEQHVVVFVKCSIGCNKMVCNVRSDKRTENNVAVAVTG